MPRLNLFLCVKCGEGTDDCFHAGRLKNFFMLTVSVELGSLIALRLVNVHLSDHAAQ